MNRLVDRFNRQRVLTGLLAALAWTAPQAAQAEDLGTIMPMGDSITLGVPVAGGYRDPLYTLLTNRTDTFTFVGSATGYPTDALTAAGQTHHEGHSGYVITNGTGRSGLDEYLAGWIGPDKITPDKILLMIGSNDINLGYDMANAPTRLSHLIHHIYALCPDVRLYLATLIPMSAGGHQTDVQTFNAALPTVVANHQALGHNVILVPMYEALNISTDLNDGLHPNAQGYLRMAQAWDTALHTSPSLMTAVARPADGQSFTVGSSISATATVLNATGAYTVHIYTNSGAGAFAEAGTGSASTPYTVNLGALPTGTYHICSSVTDTLTTRYSATNTFTVAVAPTAYPAVSLLSAGDSIGGGTSFSVGWDFTVTQSIRITALGQFDPDSNPKSNSVALYQRGGAKLIETAVLASSPSETSGNFPARYAAVSELELSPGNYVVVSTQNGDNFISGGGSPQATLGYGLIWNLGVALSSGSAAGPLPGTAPANWPIENSSPFRYFGPTFKYSLVSAVPLLTLTCPANNQAFATSESISATATVVNAAGDYSVHVYMNSGDGPFSEVGSGGSSSPYVASIGTLAAGTYHIYASATDAIATTNTATNTFTVAVVGPDIWASGATANWNVSGNWTAESANRPPASKDSLVFGATTGTTTLTNDLTTAAFNVAGLAFTSAAPAYTVNGNAFTLSGDITNGSSSAQTLNTPLSLTSERTVSTAPGNITLGGTITGTGAGGLVKTGSGMLTLTKQNAYSNVTVNGGTLRLNHSGNTADTLRGTLTVNNGGTLSFGTYNQFGQGPTIPVVVNAGGAVDSSGTVTTFRNLKLAGGNLLGKGGFNSSWGTYALLGTLSVTADSSIHPVSGNNNSISPGEFNGNQTLTIDVSPGATLNGQLSFLDYAHATPRIYALSKTGQGTAVFSGTNTYSGGTTLQAGTLAISAYTNLPTVGALTFTGGTLRVTGTAVTNLNPYAVNWTSRGGGFDVSDGGNTLQVTNALAGAGSLLKLGAGALTLSGANSYSGDTTNSAGLLRLANPSAVSNSTVVMDGGACVFAGSAGTNVAFGGLANTAAGLTSVVALTNETGAAVALTLGSKGVAMSYSGILSGAGSLTKVGNGTLTLSGTNTYSGGTRLMGGVLSVADTNNLPVSGGLTFNGGTLQLTNPSITSLDDYAVNWSSFDGGLDLTNAAHAMLLTNAIAGTGRLTKLGAGTLTLSKINTHSGVTTNGGGALVLMDRAALTNSTLAMSGGTLVFGGSLSSAIFGGLAASASGAGYNVALTNSLGAAVPLTVGGNGNNTIYAGVLSGSASLTKTGNGSLTLSGANTPYSGNTTNGAGLLALGHTNALGSGTLVMNGGSLGASADLSAMPGVVNAVVLLQDSLITNASNLRLSGLVSGNPNSLTKSGSGTLTLSGGVTVSNVTVNGGTLTLARLPGNVSETLLPKGTFTVNSGGTLTFAGYNQLRNATMTPPVVVNAGGVVDSGGTVTTFRDLKLAGGTMRATGNFGPQWGTFVLFGRLDVTTNSSILNISGGVNNAITPGAHQGNQTLSINVSESATLTNSVPIRNSETDTTKIPVVYSIAKTGPGSAVFTAENTYGGNTTVSAGALTLAHMYAASNSTVVMNGGRVVFSSAVSGNAFTFGGLASTGSGAGYAIALTNEAGSAVTLTVGANNTNTTYAGVLSGSGSLVKVGTGTLTLTGTNTYTGGTIVNAGSLVATNLSTLGDTPAVTLALGTTLAVSTGGETFNGDLTVNVSSNSASLLAVSGSLTLGPDSSLTVAPGSQFNRRKTYTVVTCTALSGTFGSVNGLPKTWFARYASNRVELFYAEGTLIRLH